MSKNRYFLGFIGISLVIIVIFSMGMLAIVNGNQSVNHTDTALNTESGKAVFVGNYELNISWKTFNSQSTGKVFFSQTSTITDKTANVSFTTLNYTTLSGLKVGTYYILIQNGSTFPLTTYEFTGIVPVSSVLESFNVRYIGNDQFNVSWNAFKGQTVVRVYYALGNTTNLTNTSSFVIGSSLPYLTITLTNFTTKNVNFLLVNDSLFPTGEVNYTSFIVVSSMHSQNGLLISFNGYGVFFNYIWLFVIAIVVSLIIIMRHDKHKRE